MAVTQLVGFEGQDISELRIDGVNLGGTVILSTTTARSGSASLRCNPASGASGFCQMGTAWDGTAIVKAFLHFGLYVTTLPSVARRIVGNSIGATLKLNPSGTLEVFDTTTSRGASSTALTTGTWYWIGFRMSAGTTVPVLQINGTDEVTATVAAANVVDIGLSGTEASAADIFIDDLIMESAGFLAPSKVALLLPISDNARAAKWTGGALGTASLFDAVNNTPPIGTATETDLTQIEHSGGAAAATDAYDANMTTYATAGVGASDTVLAIGPLIAHGEDVAPGTKNLNFSLVSNPTQATGLANFTAGADIGALGTYPTNWTITRNTIIASPTVTVGTSPVMRVTRPETATRVASVCFMGMLVAWTPAAAADSVPYFRPYTQLLAH